MDSAKTSYRTHIIQSAAFLQKLHEDYNWNVYDIAEKLGVSEATIRKALKDGEVWKPISLAAQGIVTALEQQAASVKDTKEQPYVVTALLYQMQAQVIIPILQAFNIQYSVLSTAPSAKETKE